MQQYNNNSEEKWKKNPKTGRTFLCAWYSATAWCSLWYFAKWTRHEANNQRLRTTTTTTKITLQFITVDSIWFWNHFFFFRSPIALNKTEWSEQQQTRKKNDVHFVRFALSNAECICSYMLLCCIWNFVQNGMISRLISWRNSLSNSLGCALFCSLCVRDLE